MKRNLSKILFAIGLAFFAGEALAQSSVTINAAVVKSCSVTAFTNVINVGNYDPASGTAATANGSFTVVCNKGTEYAWIVNDGLHASGTRRLESGGTTPDHLSYDLAMSTDGFTSSTAAPLGMTVPVLGQKSTGRTNPMTLGMRVSLPAGQDVSSDLGGYSDTVVVTIAVAP